MSAPDLATIFGLEEAIEPVIAAVLSAGAGNIQALTNFSAADDAIPRYEVILEVGEQVIGDHQAVVKMGGQQVVLPDTWRISVVVRTVANRSKPGLVGQAHMRALARVAMLAHIDNFPASALPYHDICINREAGTALSVIQSEDEDVSETRFEGVVSIRANAWPVDM